MNGWHAFDKDDPGPELQDHHYYLVTHTDYKTPMKAKWHSELGGGWEVLGCAGDGWTETKEEFWYSWDANNPIIAWMDLPDIFQSEFTDEQLCRLDQIQEATEEYFSVLAETDDKVWDLDDIWSVIYLACQLLHKRGRKVRLPTHVTMKDGTEYITDWYEEDKDADMDN